MGFKPGTYCFSIFHDLALLFCFFFSPSFFGGEMMMRRLVDERRISEDLIVDV